MLYTIKGQIGVEQEEKTGQCYVQITVERAPDLLHCITAIELNRAACFQIAGEDGTIKFVKVQGMEGALDFEMQCQGIHLSGRFTKNDVELIKCFCVDVVFKTYPYPHIDIELPFCDITFWTQNR